MSTGRNFQITYTMTPRDYAAMGRALTRRSWRYSAIALTLWLLCVWCIAAWLTGIFNPLAMIRSLFQSRLSLWAVAVLGMGVLVTFFSHWLSWTFSFLCYKQIASANTTITMGLTDEAIETSSSVADSTLPWTAVKRVIREIDYLFLPISKRESLILPRRSFASDAEFDEACQYVVERVSA